MVTFAAREFVEKLNGKLSELTNLRGNCKAGTSAAEADLILPACCRG